MADCTVCRNLQPDRFDLGPTEIESGATVVTHKLGRCLDIPRRALAASAQAGCETCLIIHEAWKATAIGLSAYMAYVYLWYTTAEAPIRLIGANVRHNINPAEAMSQIYSSQGGEASKVWPSIGVAQHVLDDPVSTAAMKVAKEWLSGCLATHAECQTSLETQLPTCVIEICAEGQNLSLLVTNGAKGKYVTLSHCWGNAIFLTTTKATLEKIVAGITMGRLPKTFQDAISVTHLMGFKYLWIDSLCIVQDSKEDWDIESSRMQNIYAHAIFNISADSGRDSTTGLGTGRRLSPGIAVSNPKNGDRVHARPFYHSTDSSGVSHVPSQEKNLKHVLDTRAWVLQERMLSPRILHFSEYEMAWECDTCCRCECSVPPRESKARPFRTISADNHLSTDGNLKAWYALIQKYSSLNLTHKSDKLPAFAGLASKAAKSLNRTYVAGLWKEDLPYCLPWYVSLHHSDSTRLGEYIPSWSWASIDGEVMMDWSAYSRSDFHVTYESQILGVDFSYEGRSVYGSLRYGVINIKGKKAPVSFDDQHTPTMDTPEWAYEGDVVRPDVPDWSEFQNADDCFLFIIYMYESRNQSDQLLDRKTRAVALILRPANSRPGSSPLRTCYRRIGYYWLWREKNSSAFLRQFQDEEICLV